MFKTVNLNDLLLFLPYQIKILAWSYMIAQTIQDLIEKMKK